MFAASPVVHPFSSLILLIFLSDDGIKIPSLTEVTHCTRSLASSFIRRIDKMIYFFRKCSSLSLSTTMFFLSLSLYHSTSSLAHPAARCNRFQNPTTHALRVVATACCTSSSSSCLPSLSSQCHRCGETGRRSRGHGPGACSQDRQVVIVNFIAKLNSGNG